MKEEQEELRPQISVKLKQKNVLDTIWGVCLEIKEEIVNTWGKV